ncbi:MAG: agmatinase family protein, partial [Bdellovibrionota bacterium]
IRRASPQLDLFDLDYVDPFRAGLYLRPESRFFLGLNKKMRPLAEKIIQASEEEVARSKALQKVLAQVNRASQEVNRWVYDESKKLLAKNKMPVVVGGDHSSPLGAIRAYAEKFPGMGVLHFDAHSDTRRAYMGFQYSHASIMYNVAQECAGVSKIVQVGIRDFCEAEYHYTTRENSKFQVYFDRDLKDMVFTGIPFQTVARQIVAHLPELVYLSVDIDALDPRYCPNTGTPVPGGLDYMELISIVREIVRSKRKIVGFDLCEVAPGSGPKDEWDANVGMRLLYKITALALGSQGLLAAFEGKSN